jgi:hypothetical protein
MDYLEIYLCNTHQYNQERVKYPEIGTEFSYLPQTDVFYEPDQYRDAQQQIK